MTIRRSVGTASKPRLRHGMTMVEVLVATGVGLLLVSALAAAFVQIVQASDESQAQVRAHGAARAATERMASELRTLSLDVNSTFHQFEIINQPLAYGDGIDNDNDGQIDEEVFDGFDTDGDWLPGSDRHTELAPGVYERGDYRTAPDHGDAAIDEDCVFSEDEISFIVPGAPRLRVSYRLGEFEGEQNVLLRGVITNPAPAPPYGDEVVEPVVFDVVSLDILAWNANDDVVVPTGVAADRPYWVSEWDATTKFPPLTPVGASPAANVPPFKLPAAVLISVTTNAERQPLMHLPNWQGNPLKTVRVQTVVTVESVTQDNRYFRFVRRP